jgi:hypothetical protein
MAHTIHRDVIEEDKLLIAAPMRYAAERFASNHAIPHSAWTHVHSAEQLRGWKRGSQMVCTGSWSDPFAVPVQLLEMMACREIKHLPDYEWPKE